MLPFTKLALVPYIIYEVFYPSRIWYYNGVHSNQINILCLESGTEGSYDSVKIVQKFDGKVLTQKFLF